jgi:type II secretory pathway pseudopilin PulG
MNRRPGTTLVEVLVAIFVMAIGLLALLVLFPIGALSMAKAIQDQRTSEAAISATANFLARGFGNDSLVLADPSAFGYNASFPYDAYINPYPTDAGGNQFLPSVNFNNPSYPLLIDPFGVLNGPSGTWRYWVGGITPPFVPPINAPVWPQQVPGTNIVSQGTTYQIGCLARRQVEYFNNGAAPGSPAWRTAFSLWDDLLYTPADSIVPGQTPGLPLLVTPSTCVRDNRMSWAYLCQRPNAGDPTVVNCSILVFDRRSLILNGTEHVYSGNLGNTSYFDTRNNIITIDYTNNIQPPVSAGDWILDVTLDVRNDPNAVNPAVSPTVWVPELVPHAYAYRVVGVKLFTDSIGGVPNRELAQFEVQTPLRGFTVTDPASGQWKSFTGKEVLVPTPQPWPPASTQSLNSMLYGLNNPPYIPAVASLEVLTGGNIYLGVPGSTVVLEGLVEVFDKGPIRLP